MVSVRLKSSWIWRSFRAICECFKLKSNSTYILLVSSISSEIINVFFLFRRVGGFLNNNTDISFVVEDENEVIFGVAVGAYNGKEFRRRLNKSWLPNLRALYSETPYNGLEYGQVSHIKLG